MEGLREVWNAPKPIQPFRLPSRLGRKSLHQLLSGFPSFSKEGIKGRPAHHERSLKPKLQHPSLDKEKKRYAFSKHSQGKQT